MILTGESPSAGRETCHSATLYTTNLTWYGLGSKLGPRGDKPAFRLTEGSDRLRGPESQCGRFRERNNEHPVDNRKDDCINRNYQETLINCTDQFTVVTFSTAVHNVQVLLYTHAGIQQESGQAGRPLYAGKIASETHLIGCWVGRIGPYPV